MRDPDIIGRDDRVKVWEVRLGPNADREPSWVAGLGTWLVEGPFHPMWDQWLVSVITLSHIDGVQDAHQQFPGATHELSMIAINPERRCDIDAFEETGDWGDPAVPKFLTPIDQQVQWSNGTDDEARDIGALAIRTIANGHASPDSDYRAWWTQAIKASLDHTRSAGTHMPPMPEGRA